MMGSGEFSTTQYGIGAGYHTSVKTNTDFITNITYTQGETEFLGLSNDANGFAVSAGFRGLP